ncbi:MAG: YesL family protein [Lachnospiraceae bacterium]|nr:YesL family protein [Lachnospiraceae bacterium]
MFKPNGPVMQFLTEITNFLILNLLCLICCIPVVTIGAALSARMYAAMKIVRDEETGVVKPFFHAFVRNLKTGIPLTFIFLGMGALLVADWYVTFRMETAQTLWKVIFAMVTSMYLLMLWNVFPFLARYEVRVFDALKGAFSLSYLHFFRSIFGVIMMIVPWMVNIWFPVWFWLIALGIETFMLYLNAGHFARVFDRFEAEKGIAPVTAANEENEDRVFDDESRTPVVTEENA